MLITSLRIWQSEGALRTLQPLGRTPAMDERHAKTDRLDARHPRELLATGRLPESRIPPRTCLRFAPRCAPTSR
jgi:hypothetical protein